MKIFWASLLEKTNSIRPNFRSFATTGSFYENVLKTFLLRKFKFWAERAATWDDQAFWLKKLKPHSHPKSF